MKPEPSMLDAYSRPRYVAPGCQHQLGCRCDPPFWLREPTPIEDARAEHMRRPFDSTEVRT